MAIAFAALLIGVTSTPAGAEDVPRSEPAPNYPTSPYHGMLDGDGRVIPCRCRFGGRDYRLGEAVCMSTHIGTVLARCDLNLNNTSWIPTTTPCELSRWSTQRPKHPG